MEIEISDKVIQVRMYDRHADNYAVVLNLYLDGQKAFVFGLKGSGFYDNFHKLYPLLLERYGITDYHGSVMRSHARAMKYKLRRDYEVTITGDTSCAKRNMSWVHVVKRQQAESPKSDTSKEPIKAKSRKKVGPVPFYSKKVRVRRKK
jgi:hypothetical protein